MSSGGNITFFNRNFDTGNLSFATGIMLGGQVGYDFLGENTGLPAWTRYVTLALDYQYNSYNLNEKNVYINYGNFTGRATVGGAGGSQNALTFLFIRKLPLMESQDYPHGRLFPYSVWVPAWSGRQLATLTPTMWALWWSRVSVLCSRLRFRGTWLTGSGIVSRIFPAWTTFRLTLTRRTAPLCSG